ncbi:hypothetical protein ANN_02435 [Periplaneta americana]|uniref:Wolframin n=1 Tax=Periplaneta americana TaxID=6978 RepID=A0ABQ8TWD9_PERAM|nr:hypothetical protein ANN_02435 [Periplaneta americana]
MWTDGPRGSLRRLRSQLAEDGCPESQVILAKLLLEEKCELEVDKEENSRLGVYWLIKASEQGNTEATNILKQCLETGQGITEHNYVDVKSCLSMSQDEKLARKAAREMFSSLSSGQDFITTDQLQRRMKLVEKNSDKGNDTAQVTFEDPEPKQNDDGDSATGKDAGGNQQVVNEMAQGTNEDWRSKGEYSGEKLTEDHLVSAAAMYARGELPLVHQVLSLTSPSHPHIDAMNFLHRVFLHPVITLRSLYAKVLETLAKQGAPFMSYVFPTALTHIQTLILLFVYSVLGTESIILFIPMILYYASFVVMVVSTFQMLHRRREFSDFRVWSQLFLSYSGGNLNPEEAEYQYCSSKLKPYGHFFLALLINLVVYPLIAPQWTPQSEITILAFFLTMLTLYTFMDDKRVPDFLALFSFAVHVLAKYPYETDAVVRQGWRFLDIRIPTFASYVVGNGVEFCLNFRAVFYLFIPAVFLKIAARDNWRGTYKTLIPHCVTLSWWQVAVISSQGATWYGLIRSTLALVGLVLFLPLAGLATILLPVAAVGKYLADSAVLVRVTATVALASLPLALSWYLGRCRAHGTAGGFIDKLITRIQIILGVVAAVSLLLPTLSDMVGQTDSVVDYSEGSGGSLSWEQYQNHCHQPAWEQSSVALVQLRCSHLAGSPIGWDGYVTDVRIRSISNTLEALFQGMLPTSLRDALTCFYGDKYDPDCDEETTPEHALASCKLLKDLKLRHTSCHLEAWNRYKFEVRVKMKSGMWGKGAEVTLIADDSFRNFTLALRPGDRVWFAGYLMSGGGKDSSDHLLGGLKPQVDLEEIGCLGCHRSELQIHKKASGGLKVGSSTSLVAYGYAGLKSVLNFIFNPLVIFK